MKKNVLVTGLPRSGKSTLLRTVVADFENKVGFVTNEIREDNERTGFEIETNDGFKSTLASVNFKTDYKVSRYFVNVDNLDAIIPRVEQYNSSALLYLDEIGQMELFSARFKNLVEKYLDSPNICIATLSKVHSDTFTEWVRNRNDVIIVEINEENREARQGFVTLLLKKIEKAERYSAEPERFYMNQDGINLRTDHGVRRLKKSDEKWVCECDFFIENRICSHVIAVDSYLQRK